MPGDGDRDFEPIPIPGQDGPFGTPNKKIGLILAGCGLVMLAGLVAVGVIDRRHIQGVCIGDDCLTIKANKVTVDASNQLTGSFTVRKGSLFNSIHSQGIAGACLFVESAALNLPPAATLAGEKCTTDKQCGGVLEDDKSTTADDAFVGWEGICHRDTGTCWIRPGGGIERTSSVCNKGVKAALDWPTKSNIPAFDPSTLRDKLTDAAKGKPINVRVFACLNSPFTPGPNVTPPCGGGDGSTLTDFGEVSNVSVGP